MAKSKTAYQCRECGGNSSKWQGQCPHCFVWNSLEETWNKGFALLSAYKEANGDCLVPLRYKVDGFNLGSWVSVQRKTKTSLTKERLDKLNSLGFVWATK